MSGADPEDLTARARIRDAALRHFGEYGFERSTIRGIAAEAGVSSGLVRHHFGSKEALRDACDTYLARMLRELTDQVDADPAPGGENYVGTARAAFGPYQAYVARSLAEGRAETLVDTLIELGTRQIIAADERRADDDPPEVSPRARATVTAAWALSILVLKEHVSRGLGLDVFSSAGDDLLARALLDLYSHPWLSPEEASAMRARLPRREDGR